MHENGNHRGLAWWRNLWARWGALERPAVDLLQYRRLALQLHHRLPRSESKRTVLLVTPSDSPLCARSTTLLACCAADELLRPVLLIDASSREKETTRMLEGVGRPGLSDLVDDPALRLEDVVIPTSHVKVSFLPAGESQDSFAAPDLAGVLEAANDRYDLVLLSGGSVLNDPRSLALASRVGCVLLLAIENETRVEDLHAAQNALSLSKARQVGLVLTTPIENRAQPPL